jgi:transcriptional regulator with XRE-family HTH domain
MEQETEKIIEKLRETRLEKRISLLNLANEVEISHSHLYYIEKKKVAPSVDLVVKLAKALDLSWQDFEQV